MTDRLSLIALHQALEAKRAIKEVRREIANLSERMLDLEMLLEALVEELR